MKHGHMRLKGMIKREIGETVAFLIEGMGGEAYLKFCIFVFLKVYLFAVRGS